MGNDPHHTSLNFHRDILPGLADIPLPVLQRATAHRGAGHGAMALRTQLSLGGAGSGLVPRRSQA